MRFVDWLSPREQFTFICAEYLFASKECIYGIRCATMKFDKYSDYSRDLMHCMEGWKMNWNCNTMWTDVLLFLKHIFTIDGICCVAIPLKMLSILTFCHNYGHKGIAIERVKMTVSTLTSMFHHDSVQFHLSKRIQINSIASISTETELIVWILISSQHLNNPPKIESGENGSAM